MRVTLLIIFILFSYNYSYSQEVNESVALNSQGQLTTVEQDKPDIKIFPVPVLNNRFTITSDVPFKFVRMTNIIGQEITRERLVFPVSRREIEFSGAEKGIYLVTIELEDNRKIVRKILVDTSR